MPLIIIGILKTIVTTFLTEKVVISLVLKIVAHLAKRTSNELDDEAVRIFQSAYDNKIRNKK